MALLGSLLLAETLAASPRAPAETLYRQTRPAMGTTVEIRLYAADTSRAGELFEAAFSELERVEASLSGYRPSSELCRINAKAALGPVTTDPEVFGLLERAIAFSRRSQGAFDVTVGRLMKAWGFFRGRGSYPSQLALTQARTQTGWRHVELDPARRTVRFLSPGLELDLGAIGKGYALDRVADSLRKLAVAGALIGAGQSSYYALGAPPGEPGWSIKVPAPAHAGRTLSTVRLRDAAVSTSGGYGKSFERAGRHYGHILDPRSGRPVEGMLQVTVLAASAADADALSTSLFVLGAEEGAKLLQGGPGAAALLIDGTLERPAFHSLNWPVEVADTRH